jgi:hypothetical protein
MLYHLEPKFVSAALRYYIAAENYTQIEAVL